MKKFEISVRGDYFGTYEGADADAAVEAYARNAGFKSYAELCDVVGEDSTDWRDVIEVVEFKTARHIMVTVRPEDEDEDAPMPNGDGIVSQGDREVASPEALKEVALSLFYKAEADIKAGKYGDGAFRLMVIDYTADEAGRDLHDEIVRS
ncbi:hypothetical protein [Aureimonas sp. N4]|uniref:hypothetical protein n=1 Tax=Aureimonas sp. N4 TaxID=1638165 RepID=UPI0007820D6F|nr:hypothetical protein [Aureimonas sp. N4]